MKNRILSVILAVLMIMSCFGTLAVTAAEYTTPTVAVECSEIGTDNTFTADIVIYNNPGISGYEYAVKFDNSMIQIVDVVRDEDDVPESVFPAEATLNIDEGSAAPSTYSELKANAARAKASDKNGVLLTIIFKVVGEFEETILSIDDEMFVDVNQDEVNFTIVKGSVGLPTIEGVTFDGATFVYDGTEKSIAVKGATSAMTVEYSPKTAKNVGTNKITATVKQAGYATLTLTADLKITPKALTIDGIKVADKTFDNTTAAEVDYTNAKLVGVVAGDDVTFTKPAATFADANVGTGKTMTMDAITLGGAAAGNYTLTQPTLKGVIVQRTVTIVPNPGQGKKLNDNDPVITYTVDGDLCGYTLAGALSREAGDTAKTYKITIGTLKTNPDNGNIKLVVADEVFTVYDKDPQDATVKLSETTAVYGTTGLKVMIADHVGPANPTITYTSSNEDVVTVDAAGNITIVGVGKANISVTIAGDDTYAPLPTVVLPIEITGIPVTVTPTAGQSFVYGDTITIAYTADVDGVNFTGALAPASKNAGTQSVVLGTLAAKNYTITVASATVTITPKTLTITGVEVWPTKKPTIKENNPVLVGVESGDVVSVGTTGVVGAELVGGVCKVTNLKLEGEDAANYTLDTTVAYNYTTDKAAADYVADVIEGASDIKDTGSDMTKAGLIAQIENDVTLPAGAEITDVTADVAGIIDADGKIVRPAEDTVVTFTFTVTVDGATSTFTKTLEIASSKDNGRLLALMYYYYMMNLNKKDTVASVQASVASGEVVKGTTVTLTTETAGATIYYTTDGKTPTTASTVYTGPITINENVTIKAIAVKAGMKNSGVVVFTYKAVDAKTSVALKADAANIKYMAGYADGTFKPNQVATRYEVVAALNNLLDITTNVAPKALTDVSADMKAIVDKFTAAGIIEGFPTGEFKGNEGITRAQFATIAAKILGLDTANAKDAGFKDVSGWAAPYVNACAAAGLVVGYDDGTYQPSKNITRAELVTFINRITGAKAGTTCSYSDVLADAWYFGYVAAAAK